MKQKRAPRIRRPDIRIDIARSAAEIGRCHAVMRELRPRHAQCAAFVRQVQKQRREGFELAYLEAGGEVRSLAGYRIMEMLFSGRTLYVDDLVTREADRSCGFGGQLFDWVVQRARALKCDAFTLDSGVQRFGAHRFYLSKRMNIESHHFMLEL